MDSFGTPNGATARPSSTTRALRAQPRGTALPDFSSTHFAARATATRTTRASRALRKGAVLLATISTPLVARASFESTIVVSRVRKRETARTGSTTPVCVVARASRTRLVNLARPPVVAQSATTTTQMDAMGRPPTPTRPARRARPRVTVAILPTDQRATAQASWTPPAWSVVPRRAVCQASFKTSAAAPATQPLTSAASTALEVDTVQLGTTTTTMTWRTHSAVTEPVPATKIARRVQRPEVVLRASTSTPPCAATAAGLRTAVSTARVRARVCMGTTTTTRSARGRVQQTTRAGSVPSAGSAKTDTTTTAQHATAPRPRTRRASRALRSRPVPLGTTLIFRAAMGRDRRTTAVASATAAASATRASSTTSRSARERVPQMIPANLVRRGKGAHPRWSCTPGRATDWVTPTQHVASKPVERATSKERLAINNAHCNTATGVSGQIRNTEVN